MVFSKGLLRHWLEVLSTTKSDQEVIVLRCLKGGGSGVVCEHRVGSRGRAGVLGLVSLGWCPWAGVLGLSQGMEGALL